MKDKKFQTLKALDHPNPFLMSLDTINMIDERAALWHNPHH